MQVLRKGANGVAKFPPEREALELLHPGFLAVWILRKGTNGVSTNGVTANFMFFDSRTSGSGRRPRLPSRTFKQPTLQQRRKHLTDSSAAHVVVCFVSGEIQKRRLLK